MLNPMPFAQNIPRNQYMTRAEKMQMNLQASEIDHLKMIDSFGNLHKKGLQKDELYNFKLHQFKEASQMRTENLKEANA